MRGQRRRKTCALVSGGVESAALLKILLDRGDTVYPVYIRSGYRWETAERRSLQRLLKALASKRLKTVTTLHFPARELNGERHWGFTGRSVPGAGSADAAVYLPGRNILLTAAASVFCASRDLDAIALGTLKGNPFADASGGFFASMGTALTLGLGSPLRIEAPFRKLTKAQVVRSAGGLPWNLTFSCLSPVSGRHCGRCNKCEERRKVLGSGPPRHKARRA